MDFSQLSQAPSGPPTVSPYEIFKRLPRLPNTPNDLWTGQVEALKAWDAARNKRDALIELNTGAGKTLVGLLIAQSLVNEGLDRVVYACGSIDLVLQTEREAKRIGIETTLRIKGDFSNDLYDEGKAFCLTTYQAVFNGLSTFRRHPPKALICDDAHVAEAMIRDAVTLNVTITDHPALYDALVQLFEPHFSDLERTGEFSDAISGNTPTIVLATPDGVIERKAQIRALFEEAGASDDAALKYPYAHVRDRLDRCAVLFGRGRCEITPPFLPSQALPVLEAAERRVYLSATLSSATDFIRAFGKRPDVTIAPAADAGNGERLVLSDGPVVGGLTDAWASDLAKKHKVLIAVPTYRAASDWKTVAVPPTAADFSASLNSFRQASSGAFLLVSRVDGIDLPDDTCRLMILQRLPESASLLERYLWEFLHLETAHGSRMANRLAQLFGRINRGRNDYGVFFILGKSLNAWLAKERNLALMPPLLQQQIRLGRDVQTQLKLNAATEVNKATDAVLGRDKQWLAYYQNASQPAPLDPEVVGKAKEIEHGLASAAEAEAAYALASWDRDWDAARSSLEASIATTAHTDARLAGWHNLWLGGAYYRAGDSDSAEDAFQRARKQIGRQLLVPARRRAGTDQSKQADLSAFAEAIAEIVEVTSHETFDKRFGQLKQRLSALGGGSSSQMEEAVRELGAALGYIASRPDNENDTGPDVLWRDASNALALELKTDKVGTATTYNKKEVAQALDSEQWVRSTYGSHDLLGFLFVGPDGVSHSQANPSPIQWICTSVRLVAVRDRLLALIQDLRTALPIERRSKLVAAASSPSWQLAALFEELRVTKLGKD